EERMDEGARLGRGHELLKDLAFAPQSLFEAKRCRRFHRIDRPHRRFLAAGALPCGGAVVREEARIGARFRELRVILAHAAPGRAARDRAFGKALRALEEIALDDLV